MFDKVDESTVITKDVSTDTGWERLRLMFTFDEDISPELNSAMHAGLTGIFFGALYGGFVKSRLAYIDFFERNQATAFRSHVEAKKVLQDHVTINFAKGALYWGWRLGLFSSSLVLISTAVSIYRGKSGILEYTVAGCVSGCLFRANLGVRGMLVGGLLGSALGTIGGCVIFAILKASGFTMEDIRNTQYQWRKYRTETKQKWMKVATEKETVENKLLKHHDAKLESRALPGSEPELDSN
ncbi:RPII140-upstream gene protein [Gryllus bimaculatus]|nr:RPII140-upstream gene protein [Gryllus bimaculatus]